LGSNAFSKLKNDAPREICLLALPAQASRNTLHKTLKGLSITRLQSPYTVKQSSIKKEN
jgi:hypothetical protein